MILESVPTKNWKPYKNEEQFDQNAENLAIFKENDKRTRLGCFGVTAMLS